METQVLPASSVRFWSHSIIIPVLNIKTSTTLSKREGQAPDNTSSTNLYKRLIVPTKPIQGPALTQLGPQGALVGLI